MAASLSSVFQHLKDVDKCEFLKFIRYLSLEFGTSLPCNRFAFGNCVEYAIADVISKTPLKVVQKQNAKRIDVAIENFGEFSIKYSSGGAIKLHNSNNTSNTDMNMHDTLLITPAEWWFLRPSEIELLDIPLKDYLENTGDGLALKASILKILKKKGYSYQFDLNIDIDKSKCKHRETSRVLYDYIKSQLQ